jgi:hypothetical protein
MMHFEVGNHEVECPKDRFKAPFPLQRQPRTLFGDFERDTEPHDEEANDPDASALPTVFAHSRKSERHTIFYQAPPRIAAFALDAYPFLAALRMPTIARDARALMSWRLNLPPPQLERNLVVLHEADSYGHGLLLVPRIEEAVHVMLGEEDFERERDGRRFVGAARWEGAHSRKELNAFSYSLGVTLGHLHWRLALDGLGFSITGGRLHGSPVTQQRLFVQCDPRFSRPVLDDDDDAIGHLAYVLTRLAYTPRPSQEDLFEQFRNGYVDGSGRSAKARAVMDELALSLGD